MSDQPANDETSNGQTQDDQTTTQSAEELAAENARLQSALKAANNESAGRRKRLEELEAAEKQRQEAELSEIDKLNKRLADAEQAKTQATQQAQQTLLRAAFVAEAAKADAQFPEDAFRLADLSGVTVDDSGTVTGVAEAVKAIVENGRLPVKRQRAPSLDAGAGGSQSPADAKATALTEAEIATARKMGVTPEQYAAHKQK